MMSGRLPVGGSSLPYTHWKGFDHLFIPFDGTEPEWCRLCGSYEDEGRHVPVNPSDPALSYGWDSLVGADPMWWRPEGWNTGGGSCSYAAEPTFEDAVARCRQYAADGDHEGRRYEHWHVVETVRTVVATSFNHPVDVSGGS